MVALDEHFRHSATAVRTHWHPVGKSVPSAQSADHVPTLAARPLFTSATTVVNINGRAHFFGDALGFTPSTALTQYLYTQQYYDLVNNTYYDWARNYDPMTGMFDQRDYGYSGTLTDPMTDLPYTFTGGDPVNMLDLNGHAFSMPDVMASIDVEEDIDASQATADGNALDRAMSDKLFDVDLGIQAGGASGGILPHAFLYIPAIAGGEGMKYDVGRFPGGFLFVHPVSLQQVRAGTLFGKALFTIADFTPQQYALWTAVAVYGLPSVERSASGFLPQQLLEGLQFSYTFLPGTVNCYKWTALAAFSAITISRVPLL